MSEDVALIEQRLIRGGAIVHEPFVTQAGERADTKIDIPPVLERDFLLRRKVVSAMAGRLALHRPQALISVLTGADQLCLELSQQMGLVYIELEKPQRGPGSRRSIHYKTSGNQRTAASNRVARVAIVDDVFTTGSSIRGVSQLPELHDKVVAGAAIWRRNDPQQPHSLPFSMEFLIERYVPLKSE